MIDFNAFLNAIFDAAIEAKVAPLRKQIEALNAQGLAGIVRPMADGEVRFTDEIEKLVDARVEHAIDAHKQDYDHDEFVTEGDRRDKIIDVLDDVFLSKFEAALDGTRVTLNT